MPDPLGTPESVQLKPPRRTPRRVRHVSSPSALPSFTDAVASWSQSVQQVSDDDEAVPLCVIVEAPGPPKSGRRSLSSGDLPSTGLRGNAACQDPELCLYLPTGANNVNAFKTD